MSKPLTSIQIIERAKGAAEEPRAILAEMRLLAKDTAPEWQLRMLIGIIRDRAEQALIDTGRAPQRRPRE